MMTMTAEKEKMTQDEFLEKIRMIQDQIVGYENMGGHTEYFDEDGVVLMETDQLDDGRVEIRFSDDINETYDFSLIG